MSAANNTTQTSWPERKINWPAIFVLMTVLAVIVAALLYWLRYPLVDLIGTVLLMLIMVSLGILGHRYKFIQVAIDRFSTLYFRFLGWMMISLGPLVLFTWLSRYVLANHSLSYQLIIFVLWGLLLIWAITLIFTHKRRELFFQKLQKIGSLTPIVYAFNLLMIAVTFFSSVTFALKQRGVITLTHANPADISHSVITDFYLWHFLDAVPFLDVTKTLRWEEPLTYSSAWIGFALLIFKIMVILPVIAAFAWYWKKVDSDK